MGKSVKQKWIFVGARFNGKGLVGVFERGKKEARFKFSYCTRYQIGEYYLLEVQGKSTFVTKFPEKAKGPEVTAEMIDKWNSLELIAKDQNLQRITEHKVNRKIKPTTFNCLEPLIEIASKMNVFEASRFAEAISNHVYKNALTKGKPNGKSKSKIRK